MKGLNIQAGESIKGGDWKCAELVSFWKVLLESFVKWNFWAEFCCEVVSREVRGGICGRCPVPRGITSALLSVGVN